MKVFERADLLVVAKVCARVEMSVASRADLKVVSKVLYLAVRTVDELVLRMAV